MANHKSDKSTKTDWKKNIQQGVGKKIAKEFFITFTTQERVSALLYPNRKKKGKGKKGKQNPVHYVEPTINIKCSGWQKLGFFDRSKPIYFKDSWGRQQLRYWKIMNLEPIYKFCKEKGIEFDEKEKNYSKWLLISEAHRKAILNEFPEDDIINATLQYYLKHCILRYLSILRDIMEHPEKYEQEKKKVEEMNNPKTKEGRRIRKTYDKINAKIKKEYGNDWEEKAFDVADLVAGNYADDLSNPEQSIFREYLMQKRNNQDVLASFDKKILEALKLYPFNKSERYYAPAELYTILTNQRGMFLYASLYKLLLNKKQEILQ